MTEDSDTYLEPLNLRERVFITIVRVLEFLFRVDLLNVYRRQGVYYCNHRNQWRVKMNYVSDLRDEWLDFYKKASESEEETLDDPIVYCAWLVLRSDSTINPTPTLALSKDENGNWSGELEKEPSKEEKESRKKEVLVKLDQKGFLDTVLEENNS